MQWTVETREAPAAELLAAPPPEGRLLRFLDVTRPAVVLGSSQPESTIDAGAAASGGIDVVRRPSGGGAVLVVPGEAVWVDVFIPAGDPHWHTDVGVAFHWLGRTWTAALERLGIAARWHDGPLISTPWSKTVCFAGLGPGEVVEGHGRKIVGMSQRRTRHYARFQCCALLRWDPQALLGLLAGPPPESATDLSEVASGIGVTLADGLRSEIAEAVASAPPGPRPPE